jgi:uncharacterized protein YndB with AHSA1/START domain
MSTTAESTRTLVVEREFSHAPEKIWRALTEGPLIEAWMLKNDFEPVPGRPFRMQTDPMPQWDGIIDCEVLTVEPVRRLSYKWNVGAGTPGGLETVVTWTLTPTSAGTLLRMEQSGFRADQAHNYQGAEYGWGLFFGNLERVLGNHAL